MNYLMSGLSSVVFLASIGSVTAHAGGIDVEPGMWEWSITMEMPGMPIVLPPTVYSSCVTKEDLVPKQSGESNECKMVESKITDNSVQWKMECKVDDGVAVSEGKMFYSGTTAKGEIQVSTQGMVMTSKISGRRTGVCK